MTPTIDKLDGNNCHSWSRYIIKIDVWRIVTGEELCPTGKGAIAWKKRRDLTRAELLLNISEKCIVYCVADPKKTWDDLAVLFHARGQGAVALRRRFNTMENLDLKLKEWIAEVETLVRQLNDVGDPMHTLDIYNTLVRNIPASYRALVVYFDGLPTDPSDPNCITIQHVTERLINEEARQSRYHGRDETFYASSRQSNGKRRVCYNCSEEGHVKAPSESRNPPRPSSSSFLVPPEEPCSCVLCSFE